MSIDELDTYVAMVEKARRAWAGRVDVRLGLECDYAPSNPDCRGECFACAMKSDLKVLLTDRFTGALDSATWTTEIAVGSSGRVSAGNGTARMEASTSSPTAPTRRL